MSAVNKQAPNTRYPSTNFLFPCTPHTSAEEAQSATTEFLLDHVGNQLLAGQPHSMLSATWIVPIHLAYVHTACLAVWVSLRLMKSVARPCPRRRLTKAKLRHGRCVPPKCLRYPGSFSSAYSRLPGRGQDQSR